MATLKTVFENEVFVVSHDAETVFVTNKTTGIRELATPRLLEALTRAESDCMAILDQDYIIDRPANYVQVR